MASINQYSLLPQSLQSPLQSSLQSGIKRSNDQDVSKAVNDIGASLISRAADTSSPRVDLKAKVESLIDSEVSNGRLTGDQGTELKTAFDNAFGSGNATAFDQSRGPAGQGTAGQSSSSSPPPVFADNANSDTNVANATSPAEAMRLFLKSLQDAADAQALPSYGPPGVTSKPPTQGVAPLLIDYKT